MYCDHILVCICAFILDRIVTDIGSCFFFFFQAEDGIRYLVRSRGLGDVYKRQVYADVPKAYWADRRRAVFQKRMEGMQAARAASTATGVTVKFGLEVNRALDSGRRCHRDVPVSYTHLTLPPSDQV